MLWSVPGIQQMTINIIYYIRWVCTWFTKQWRVTKGFWAEELYVSSWNSTVNNLSMKLQFSSVAQSCSTLCNPMDCSTPGFPGACWNSCPLSRWCHPTISPPVVPFSHLQSFPASGSFQMSQFFASDGQILEFQLQHQSFQWIFRTDLLSDGLVGSPSSPRDSQESSSTPQFKIINSSALSFLYGPTLTSIHDYWKNHSFD